MQKCFVFSFTTPTGHEYKMLLSRLSKQNVSHVILVSYAECASLSIRMLIRLWICGFSIPYTFCFFIFSFQVQYQISIKGRVLYLIVLMGLLLYRRRITVFSFTVCLMIVRSQRLVFGDLLWSYPPLRWPITHLNSYYSIYPLHWSSISPTVGFLGLKPVEYFHSV